ncbi:2-hydroxyacyl-CoA dehydratase [Thermoanaerobacterium thermosulfurigenes]|uniref:2-hydroxyacyl-CoA dehydratase n=1 Tax=Thermoanaerobacterium thermosulfurigenes TaxID=33950 RepID=UPI003EF6033F
MKVTFPYMGSPLIYEKLFELLGHDVITPPKPSLKTINYGVKYSPEFACFPLKVILGTYLEAIELGADTIITSGGNGPCRAGYYGEAQKKILENMGYEVDFIILDEPKRDFKGFLQKISRIKGENTWTDVLRIVNTVYKMAKSMDKIEKIIEEKRAYECNKGEFTKAWNEILSLYRRIRMPDDILFVEKEAYRRINNIEICNVPESEKIKIGIVGEIYVVMEPSINNNIEEVLNGYGVEVERAHYISEWIDNNLLPFKINKKEHDILKKAEKYIEIIIGGHAKQSIGAILDFKDRGFDGVIHLKPFGCLPELISQSIIDKISKQYDFPIISLSIDEQSATANLLTRIEAFIDVVKNKKLMVKKVK